MNFRDQPGHFTKRGESSEEPDGEVAAADSSARLQLRHAIDHAGAAEAHVAGLKASIERIEGQLYDARRRIREAREAGKLEEESQARALVDGAEVVELVRKARMAEAEAEETVRACRGGARHVPRRIERGRAPSGAAGTCGAQGCGRGDGWGGRGFARGGRKPRLRELAAKHAALGYLRGVVSSELGRRIDMALPSGIMKPNDPAVAPWKAAYERLLDDAQAPLPNG